MRNEFPSKPVLIVDDEEQFLYSINITLRSNGITNVITCISGANAKEYISKMVFSVIVLDVNIPDIRGTELLDYIVDLCPETPVVMITAIDKADVAVDCMKKGAVDYIVKPFDNEKILAVLGNAISQRELLGENEILKKYLLDANLKKPEAFNRIISGNRRMQSLFLYIEAIAATPFPVLITGETGVGKELVAQAIHDLSNRKGPFIPVNVGGIDDNTFSDTLFGHVKGAFTGADAFRPGLIEKASGGTLFLDEIGDLSKNSQIKLLRVLQNRDYLPLGSDVAKLANIRLIVATNKTVEQLKDATEFRNDLFHRLQTHHIALPPLRERMDDIPLLVENFANEAANILGKEKPYINNNVLSLLKKYSFPGNVRELKAIIFDAVSMQKDKHLSTQLIKERLDLPSETIEDDKDTRNETVSVNMDFGQKMPTIRQAVQSLIDESMHRANGNQNAAAKLLGISPQALSRRLKYISTKKKSESI